MVFICNLVQAASFVVLVVHIATVSWWTALVQFCHHLYRCTIQHAIIIHLSSQVIFVWMLLRPFAQQCPFIQVRVRWHTSSFYCSCTLFCECFSGFRLGDNSLKHRNEQHELVINNWKIFDTPTKYLFFCQIIIVRCSPFQMLWKMLCSIKRAEHSFCNRIRLFVKVFKHSIYPP